MEVGVVLAITPTGNLTVRSHRGTSPSEGTTVRDHSGEVRGRVTRVFGPVERPYLSVRLRRAPKLEEGLRLVGATLVREKGIHDATG
jgi:rRNA processing protein Gar1